MERVVAPSKILGRNKIVTSDGVRAPRQLSDGRSECLADIFSRRIYWTHSREVREGNSDHWSSIVTRDEILGNQVDQLVDCGFDGRASSLLQHLLDREMKPDELDKIQELLDDFRANQTDAKEGPHD